RHTVEGHTVCGASLVRPIGGMLANIADVIEAHHENYDGTGYAGLKGEDIPLAARIIAVADVFDALLSDRPYRKSIGVFNALDNIVHASGSRFDPKAVESLRCIINRGGEEVVAEVLAGAGRMLPVNV
ncbi:MAG: HD domain-containing protein, partial [Phycisphaerales bacterium]